MLSLTSYQEAGLKLSDCTHAEFATSPANWGSARFSAGGSTPGFNPCVANPVSVLPTTWSAVKAITQGASKP